MAENPPDARDNDSAGFHDELDELLDEHVQTNALASEEDRQEIRDFLAAFEAASPFSWAAPRCEKCSDEAAATIYSRESERELTEASLRIARDDIEDRKLSHHSAFHRLSPRGSLSTLGPPRFLLSSSLKTKKSLSVGVLGRILFLTPGVFCSHFSPG